MTLKVLFCKVDWTGVPRKMYRIVGNISENFITTKDNG